MTGRLDVSFMGKDARPILVKSAAKITHDIRWRGVTETAIFASACILAALLAWGLVIVVFAL